MALTLDELLFEPNAPLDLRRSDIQTRFHLMSLNPSRRDVVALLAERAILSQKAALPRAEAILRAASQDQLRSPSELEEFAAFVQSLAEL